MVFQLLKVEISMFNIRIALSVATSLLTFWIRLSILTHQPFNKILEIVSCIFGKLMLPKRLEVQVCLRLNVMSWTDTLFQASVLGSEASMTILCILIFFSDGNCFWATQACIRCEFVPVSNIYVRLEEESYVVLVQKAFMHETGVKRQTVTNRKIS